MTPYSTGYLLALLLVLITSPVLSQQVYSTTADSATLFPTKHGMLENYAFILNGEIIEHHKLIDYPGARLDRIFPYDNIREKDKYQGVVYFHTAWYPPSPPDQYADDPAYFINGTQVSPYAIRSSRAEAYNRIKKSIRDTVINGMWHKGSIHVHTDEDFFANRIAMPEIIKRYTGLPLEHVIVHWRGRFIDALNPGVIIHDHFPLYYINPKGIQEVKVDRIQFAEGERYVVHVVDQGYRFSILTENGWRAPERTYLVFKDPIGLDPAGPCYLTDFDTVGTVIHHRTKVEPKPFQGETAYLKKLSTVIGLSAGTPDEATVLDSITVQFIVLGNGQLTALGATTVDKPGHKRILQAIKQHPCVWPVASNGDRPLLFWRKMTIFYYRNQHGDILSLDSLEYRYDDIK
jgi:hypothetical protein